jgi:hypothetical protein
VFRCRSVARFGLIDRRIREVTPRLDVLYTLVTLDSRAVTLPCRGCATQRPWPSAPAIDWCVSHTREFTGLRHPARAGR